MLKQIAAGIFLSALLASQANSPERQVHGNTISSDHDPRMLIQLPASVQYVGADRWILYEIADCEVHVFVEANAQKNVQRLYWVQFEAYVPARPELHHTYDSPRHAQIGGTGLFRGYLGARARCANQGRVQTANTSKTIIRAKGYKMPAGMMDVRLVHLLDAEKRRN